MKVRAIESHRGNAITAGREYAVLGQENRSGDGYILVTDDGSARFVYTWRFTEVTDTPVEMILPTDPQVRKGMPITTGVVDYFPLALAEVALVSKTGNDQHNPGQPLHWEKGLSTDHADCILRHLIDRGARDADGMRHSAKLAWRALALLQTELEAAAAVKAQA